MKKIFLVLGIILIFISTLVGIKINNDKKEQQKIEKEKEIRIKIENKIKEINSHYNTYVKTNKESILYELKENNYVESGKINKNIEIELEETKIDENTTYFKIKNLNYYIKYNDVEPIEKININDRYKKYVLFNENVVTKEKTTLYNENGYAYEINESIDLPLIIKDKDKYYVEYNNTLVRIDCK